MNISCIISPLVKSHHVILSSLQAGAKAKWLLFRIILQYIAAVQSDDEISVSFFARKLKTAD